MNELMKMLPIIVDLESVRQDKVDKEREIRRLLIQLEQLNYNLMSLKHLPEIWHFIEYKIILEKILNEKLETSD